MSRSGSSTLHEINPSKKRERRKKYYPSVMQNYQLLNHSLFNENALSRYHTKTA